MPRYLRLAVLLGLAALLARAEPLEISPPQGDAPSLSLNGTWEFAYRAGSLTGAEPSAFSPIKVPGHWELQGFAEPKYGKELLEGTGFYRRTFRVPAEWAGRRVLLRFDGVLFGFDATLNGHPLGSWASGYNPVTFDVTDQLRADADNVLAVTVTTRSHGWEFDTNDCWSLSGIYRDVTLFAVPAAHLTHYTARTALAADGSATLSVATLASAPAGVKGRLLAPDGKLAGELTFASNESISAGASLAIPHPQLWTAETPALYTLELTLSSGQKFTQKIGLRQVTIVDGVLQLNGRPIKLRGVDHHDLWPDTGRATDEAKIRRDLELIKAANCNFVRTSHYPPHPRMLELCDELGLYVMDEVPFGFGEEHLADENYRAALRTRAEATVRRDENHACIVIWSVGNENQNTPLTIATARRAKELDPTRPVCFPQIGSYFAKSYEELPADIDVYAPHYPSTLTVQEYARKLTRPVIFTEYAHELGLASDQIQAQWAIMQASPRLAGGVIWMFQDQGILRTATTGQTPESTHDLGLNVWPDATHYYDSHGNQGMDGIVYSDRTPQVDYWQVRKVYSPVQITTSERKLGDHSDELTARLENRFDFRTLAGCKVEYTIVGNGLKISSRSVALKAAAHDTDIITIANGPSSAALDMFTWIEFRVLDEHGASFYEQSARLHLPGAFTPLATLSKELSANPLTLDETADAVTVTHPTFRLTVARTTGEVTLRDATNAVLATGLFPHAGRKLTEGELVRSKKENPWKTSLLSPFSPPEITVTRPESGITLRVHGHYPRWGAPDEALEGDLTLTVKPNGTIDTAYDYVPVNGHGLLLEAGLALTGAAGATEFQWYGSGPYPGYPGKDALNEFGLFHLNRADLNFQGNRRDVELAALVSPAGVGVLLIPDGPADVAVENNGAGVVLSHNAVLAGRGTKFVGPDTFPKAETTAHIAGHFTLLPLGQTRPAAVISWLGEPRAAQPFQPYYHSYDQ